MFFPQAIIARYFWYKYSFPVIPVVILCRVIGLFIYLLGSYAALRLLPVGKWVFMALALSPMALFQAATLNADGFTNAASFLFIGMTLSIYADENATLRPWKLWGIAGASILLGLAKPGTIILLPLLILFTLRKSRSKSLMLTVWAGVILAVMITIGWNVAVLPGSHFTEGSSTGSSGGVALILSHPLDFIFTFIRGSLTTAWSYFKDWVGVYGYWVGQVPGIIYVLYPLALVGLLVIEPRYNHFSLKSRGILLAMFFIASAAILGLYYYTHYTPGDISSFGKQGRYFIFSAPLLYLAAAGWVSVNGKWKTRIQGIAIGLFLGVLGLYSYGLYATYYTYCGSSIYTFQSCVQPVYKNLDKSSPPVTLLNNINPIRQSFVSVCGNVTSVQVQVASIPKDGQGTVDFSLVGSSGQILATQNYAVSEIQDGSNVVLPVPVGEAQNGPGYEIRLEAQDIKPPEAIGLAISPGNLLPGSELFSANIAENSVLVFHYTCPGFWQGTR